MEAPEYYEYIRLRDVFMRDVATLDAMIDTISVQKRLLGNVASREVSYTVNGRLDAAIKGLIKLKAELQSEVNNLHESISEVAAS